MTFGSNGHRMHLRSATRSPNVAGDIRRLLSPQGARSEGMVPPLSPQIRNLREPCLIGYLCGFIHQNSDAAFVRKYYVFAHKFPRNSIRSLLRILHCDCLFSQTNPKVLYYKQPLCFLMCEHLIYRVVVYYVAISHLLRE